MTTEPPATRALGPRFRDALGYAARLHEGQTRRGGQIPYLSHLLSTCALVLEDGGDEDEAIAALLHDGPEDCGGKQTLEDIRQRFGKRVASIVEACTDTFERPKPAWKARKLRFVESLRSAPSEVRRVAAADKLHNARSILEDHRIIGDAIFDRFSAAKEETLWYYESVVGALHEAGGTGLLPLLEETVEQLGKRAR